MIYLASDHAGFELKNKIKTWLLEAGHKLEDCGPDRLDPDDDYPDLIRRAITQVEDSDQAIVLGGSGQGEAIVANRHQGIRAVVYYGGQLEIIKLSRQHNDANVLCLGARFLTDQEATEAVKLWLETMFSGEKRHQRRIEKL